MKNSHVPVTLPTRIADLEFNTIMDTGFFGAFSMTQEIHSHPYFELLAAVCGEFRIEPLLGEAIMMRSGMLCVIPPGCYHCTCAVSEKPEKLAIRFNYRQLKDTEIIVSVYENFDKPFSVISSPLCFTSPDLCGLMKSIRGELMNRKIASDELVNSLLQQLYIYLIRLYGLQEESLTGTHEKKTDDSLNSRYYRIEIYFTEHYSKQITEEDMANELGLSKRQLSRVLRQIFNMSFREKLIDTRLHHAAKLLTRTDIPVEKIGYMVGYTTPSGFYTAFCKRFGVSGGEYRREFKQRLM